jgi:hypothetical protein
VLEKRRPLGEFHAEVGAPEQVDLRGTRSICASRSFAISQVTAEMSDPSLAGRPGKRLFTARSAAAATRMGMRAPSFS